MKTTIIFGAIFLLLIPSLLSAQSYSSKSAFHFLMKEKYKNLKELADSKPELLASKTQSGMTPSHYAAFYNRVQALEIIKEKNKNLLSHKDDDGITPIYLAALHNNIEALEYLVEHASSSILEKRSNGTTPMFAACRNDNLEAAIILYNAHPKPEIFLIPDNEGNTPIHATVKGNAVETLAWIKSQGLDVMNVNNSNGKNPLDIAIAKNCDRCIEILKGVKKNNRTQSNNLISVVASE